MAAAAGVEVDVKLTDMEPPKIVKVTWVDASAYKGWYGSQDEIPTKTLEMESVGWLIAQRDDVVVIAMTASEMRVADLLVIPLDCVRDIDSP